MSSSARDDDALEFSARALPRQAFDEGFVEPDLPRHVGRVPAPIPVRSDPVLRERRLQARPNPHAGVERRVGILEDELHRDAKPAEVFSVQRRQVPARDGDGTAVRWEEPKQNPGQSALPAAGFPDQAHDLALTNPEAHPVDRAHAPWSPSPETHRKTLHDPVCDHEIRRGPRNVAGWRLLHGGHRGDSSRDATAQHRTLLPSGLASSAGSRLPAHRLHPIPRRRRAPRVVAAAVDRVLDVLAGFRAAVANHPRSVLAAGSSRPAPACRDASAARESASSTPAPRCAPRT